MRVEVNALEKRYKDESTSILHNLSLHVNAGEKAVILGLNGAGKTTLIKCVLGLLTPDAGTIKINGCNNIRLQRKHIGVVSQYNSFDRRLSIQDNIIFHAYMYGMKRTVALTTLQGMAEDFGFSKHLDDRPSKLSGGTLRKAVLVRALVTEPNLIIMDEPTANVDPQYRNILQLYLDSVTARGGSALLSTHIRDDITEAQNATIYLLDKRKLSAISTKEVDIFFNVSRGATHGSSRINSDQGHAFSGVGNLDKR